MYRIYKGIQQTAIFAVGTSTFMYLYHKSHSNDSSLLAEVVREENDTKPVQGQAAVPKQIAQEGPLVLELKQVQVMFRHGARTPIQTIPKVQEANYDPEYLMREHQASLFPYERILLSTGQRTEWSETQRKIAETPLKSGTCVGTMTALGKDQLYLLGKNLKSCYMDALNLATYDPTKVFALSSNIKRTVESARCVLAGFFGKEQLKAFAEFCVPVTIFVTDKDYNIMMPNVDSCDVLRKLDKASFLNSESLPGFKKDRLAIEAWINKERDRNMDKIQEIQKKINLLSNSFNMEESCNKQRLIEYNKFRQPYLHDSVLRPLIEERSQAMEKVERVWADALVRNQYLSLVITEKDIKALNYLRRLEVERFERSHTSGYRFLFYFDPNPYFLNDHLCKEVYLKGSCHEETSWSSPILWKNCRFLVDDTELRTLCHKKEEQIKGSHDCSNNKTIDIQSEKPKTASFFQWYMQPTHEEQDSIGKAIRDEVWPDPIKSLEGQRRHPDNWEIDLNFVAMRDDLVARKAHGLLLPKELRRFENLIIDRATTMLYHTNTGQTSEERLNVTRLSAGPLVSKVIRMLDDKIKDKEQTPILCLYSTHDSTLAAMLESLGIWRNKWPPFGSDIRFELYKDVNSSEYYIRVLYCGKVQRINGHVADYVHWCDFKKSMLKYFICQDEYWKNCRSDILEHAKRNK